MSKNRGWIKCHRSILEDPLYLSEKFCRVAAWFDLNLLANHSEGFFRCRGVRVVVKRGQTGYGLDALAARWQWSRGKVERFMSELEADGKIVRQKSNVTTLISIVNYNGEDMDDKADSKATSKANGHETVKQTEANKNDKNVNNEENDNNSLQFEEFWRLYKKKIDREVCRKLYKKINSETHQEIIRHVTSYIQATPIKQYRANPKTYLNNERWKDEIIPSGSVNSKIIPKNVEMEDL